MNLKTYKAWLATITDVDTLLGLIDQLLPVEHYPWLNASARNPSKDWSIDTRVPHRSKQRTEAVVHRLWEIQHQPQPPALEEPS